MAIMLYISSSKPIVYKEALTGVYTKNQIYNQNNHHLLYPQRKPHKRFGIIYLPKAPPSRNPSESYKAPARLPAQISKSPL